MRARQIGQSCLYPQWCFVAWLSLALAACGGAGAQPDPPLTSIEVPAAGNPDSLLIVDCLLPAKVKKLGTQMTYLAQRRPLKTSASDCEIRGGEYVAYDRADYRTALQVWQPLADEGDAKAQTYVGEIYEKGLGVAPDYNLAAAWYRKAADQDYAPAQVNLGALSERGLGVAKDPKAALDWYRKASGLSDLDAGFVAFRNDAEAKQQLDARLAKNERELSGLRRQLVGTQKELAVARERQSEATAAASAATVATAVPAEGPDAAAERAALQQEAEALARLRADLERERKALKASAPDPAAARESEAALERSASELASRERAVEEQERALAQKQKALEQQRKTLAQDQKTVAQDQKSLEQKQEKLAGIDQTIRKLEQQAEASRAKVLTLAQAQQSRVPGPSIHLVDPALMKTRSESTAPMAIVVSGREHVVVGRVEAPAGLLTLMINDTEAKVSPAGFFETRVRVRSSGTPVAVVAVDRQGKRADQQFLLRTGGLAEVPPPASPAAAPAPAEGSYGRYYALMIGNQDYERLPDLDTARADVQAVAEILKSRYGFTVIPRYDANRYEILYILNELRNRLTPSDNLVIYYAGHGALDDANARGNWLPVDADPKNRANWISNVQISDVLNAMQAKHVLVIADSCYSGALTGTAVAELDPDAPAREREDWQRAIYSKRSRTALTSGGLAPVLDGGGSDHSVFAKALIGVLSQNDDVLQGSRLHEEIAARVSYAARRQRFEQEPLYAPISHAGHEAGDFILVPRTDTARVFLMPRFEIVRGLQPRIGRDGST